MASEIRAIHTINLGKSKSVKNMSFHAESPTEKLKANVKTALSIDGGKYIKFSNDEYGILVAAVENDNNIYFAYLNKDRKVTLKEASSKYSILKEIPANCSVLNYLWNTDRVSLYRIVVDFVKNVHEILTPIYMNIKESRENNDRPVKKNRNKNKKK